MVSYFANLFYSRVSETPNQDIIKHKVYRVSMHVCCCSHFNIHIFLVTCIVLHHFHHSNLKLQLMFRPGPVFFGMFFLMSNIIDWVFCFKYIIMANQCYLEMVVQHFFASQIEEKKLFAKWCCPYQTFVSIFLMHLYHLQIPLF